MNAKKSKILRAALSALHFSGIDRLARPLTGGDGVIFMLHRVEPGARPAFDPNGILSVTPEFLDEVLGFVKEAGFDTVSLDAVPARLKFGGGRPFACFTLDDGYRDNRDHALPVFERHKVPFTVYVPSAFADGNGELWWVTLETAIARLATVRVVMRGTEHTIATLTTLEKIAAFEQIYWWLRSIPEAEARRVVAQLATAAGFDEIQICRDLIMDWDELRAFAKHPLVTIGAHTRGHFALAKLSAEEARAEMHGSIARVEAELGLSCRHFSYPYGDATSAGEREFALARELGVTTAVTTRKGLLYDRHADRLTALPRLSLNGDYQDLRYVKVLLSGAPFALSDAARHAVDAAARLATRAGFKSPTAGPISAST